MCKAHYEFNMSNFKDITDWKGTAECDIVAELAKGKQAAPAQAQAPAQPEEKKVAPAAPVKKAPVKKTPKKELKNGNWNFFDYDKEDITCDTKEFVDKSLVHNYYSCKNLRIVIKGGKIKSLNLEGCQKVEIHIESVISELNLMNCK